MPQNFFNCMQIQKPGFQKHTRLSSPWVQNCEPIRPVYWFLFLQWAFCWNFTFKRRRTQQWNEDKRLGEAGLLRSHEEPGMALILHHSHRDGHKYPCVKGDRAQQPLHWVMWAPAHNSNLMHARVFSGGCLGGCCHWSHWEAQMSTPMSS